MEWKHISSRMEAHFVKKDKKCLFAVFTNAKYSRLLLDYSTVKDGLALRTVQEFPLPQDCPERSSVLKDLDDTESLDLGVNYARHHQSRKMDIE
ncbi:hypothetical protein CBOM_07946 [Ceraceosorus bombacis]|uniref:Uncharacterized protein n=1 Tax=Ceraceosorus bombacis TaxID=401625 RepID=A0A0P1BQ68_9BASI|nr:hypothetical protein CBOM_07946 [Ceraceosorus bombacis]